MHDIKKRQQEWKILVSEFEVQEFDFHNLKEGVFVR
jgi:hypothetical protein